MTRQQSFLLTVFFPLALVLIASCSSKDKTSDAEYFHETGVKLLQEGFYDLLPKGQATEAYAKLEQAEQAFRRAIELKEDLIESHRYLARVCALLKKYPEITVAGDFLNIGWFEADIADSHLLGPVVEALIALAEGAHRA